MMRACKYPKVMWRCYEPTFYGGQDAEGTQGDQLYDSTGTAEFMRAPFPGLPFRGESGAAAASCAQSTERCGVGPIEAPWLCRHRTSNTSTPDPLQGTGTAITHHPSPECVIPAARCSSLPLSPRGADNEFDDSDEPVTVCTPSIRNSAGALRVAGAAVAAAMLLAGVPLLMPNA